MQGYSIKKEIQSKLSIKVMLGWLLLIAIHFTYFFIIQGSYQFRDNLDVFTFMLEGVFPLILPLLATLIYAPSFANELKDRFIIYTRTRIEISRLFSIKFWTNFLLVLFSVFGYIIVLFIFAHYVVPAFDLAEHMDPESYGLNEETIIEDTYTRHTFTQLLEYGLWTYAVLYSLWLGLNAALFATIGFLCLALISNRFIALSIPTLVYLIGSYIISSFPSTRNYTFTNSLFPYGYIQQPIWTAFVPFTILVLLSVIMLIVIKKRFYKWDAFQ
ncbi:hypothetical protein SAMN04487944_11549 [Gracilibacillus ureilyticus]|uniref:ABC-2 family transporter protein n=1 Tax=Gracilibacillus ureilyticus TaxID=531814 RepID=A0A1H9TXQ7_9BACI|nr:hypothetical protein [Gracilibacillus ureilyticus]SES01909.1 hypothetical protein SAMN04487944_11549 [Gracilibacillus ureilyticus]